MTGLKALQVISGLMSKGPTGVSSAGTIVLDIAKAFLESIIPAKSVVIEILRRVPKSVFFCGGFPP